MSSGPCRRSLLLRRKLNPYVWPCGSTWQITSARGELRWADDAVAYAAWNAMPMFDDVRMHRTFIYICMHLFHPAFALFHASEFILCLIGWSGKSYIICFLHIRLIRHVEFIGLLVQTTKVDVSTCNPSLQLCRYIRHYPKHLPYNALFPVTRLYGRVCCSRFAGQRGNTQFLPDMFFLSKNAEQIGDLSV